MIYECPSCRLRTTDEVHPIDMVTNPLCIFCSANHTQKELLNWQMGHIENISSKNQTLVLRHFYRYVENEIKSMKELIYDCCQKKDKKENCGGTSS